MVIFVSIDGQKYHVRTPYSFPIYIVWEFSNSLNLFVQVDVGFASQGACQPIPLREGATVQCVPGLEGRLVYRPIAPNTVKTQKMWVYEIRNATDRVWIPAYCFSELEFLPEDFVNINYRTSQDPQSWLTYRLVVTRVILDEKLKKPVGTVVMIGAEVTQRLGDGASVTVASCATEADRLAALDKWFSVKLRPHEANGIVGMPTEIHPPLTNL